MDKTGGPAFPTKGAVVAIPKELEDDPRVHAIEIRQEGLTIRDYFAVAALTDLLGYKLFPERDFDAKAKIAYEQADAMLKERSKDAPTQT